MRASVCVVVCIIVRLAVGSDDCHDDHCGADSSISLLQGKLELSLHGGLGGSENSFSSPDDNPDDKLNYIPKQNVIVHACAKCGSSSLYEFIYEEIIGPIGRVQEMTFTVPLQFPSREWRGQMIGITPERAAKKNANSEVFSFALIRDPSERFKSSWKDKAACDSPCFVTGKKKRQQIVSDLLALAGNTSQATCLSFSEFLDAMLSIQRQGKAQQLNGHFLPQHLQHAFQAIPLDQWDMITQITCDSCATVLAEHLGDTNTTVTKFPDRHVSDSTSPHRTITPQNCPDDGFVESAEEKEKLALLTKDEYEALGPYL